MTLTQLAPPYPIFTDKSGSPLDNGYLYFGTANLNPETNPITVYYDRGLTQPAAQPLRTSNGYVMRNGSPALIYANSQFSVTVRDKKKALVIYSPVGYGISPSSTSMLLDNAAKNVTELLANTSFSYNTAISGSIQVATGDILRTLADGFAYEVAASAAINQHVTTAGGVKLYVQPSLGGYDPRAFGAKGDGVTDDSGAIEKAVNAALVGDRGVWLSPGSYVVGTGKSFSYAGDLKIAGNGDAEFILTGGAPVALSFSATTAATTTLAVDAVLGATSITVASATGIVVGQIIQFSTNTPVDTSFSYLKQSVLVVSGISGTTVFLSEPLNFGFTVAESTALTFSNKASLQMQGVKVRQTADKRFDISGLQDCQIIACEFEAYADLLGDVLFISRCHKVYGKNLRLINGRYTINASNGSRDLVFEDIYTINNRHPIDCNTWTFRTIIRRMISFNTQGSIQSHPCFEVHFEDCVDYSRETAQGGIGLRCIGGSVKQSKAFSRTTTRVADAQGPILNAAYRNIGQLYDRLYEDVEAPNAILSYRDGRALVVRRCKAGGLAVDGTGDRLASVSTDDETTMTDAMSLRRITVKQPKSPVWVTPFESFASINTIADITGITQANPAVVTTGAAHGFSNGDLVRIAGVIGMTQVNTRTFIIANVAATTFELAGEDSTGYTAYTSGGKATKGRLALTIDPTLAPGLGWSPTFNVRAVIRNDVAQLNPATAITIPAKVRNVFNIQEANYRQAIITLKAVSSTDGALVQRYQAVFFTGSVSSSTLSAVDAVVPAISTLTMALSNLRHHYFTQVTNEGGSAANDADIGQYYYSFDVVVTANNINDRIQYVEVEIEEVRMNAS